MSLVSEALLFATQHHLHQHRKGTRIPYMVHLLNVCKILAERDCSDEILAAGLLHDVVEDTEVTIEEVDRIFGEEVGFLVRGATEADKLDKKVIEKKGSWQERKKHTIDFILHEGSVEQLLVVAADKLDNLRSIYHDHGMIGGKLWSRFNATKDQQYWYFSSIAEALKQRADEHDIIKELAGQLEILVNNLWPDKAVN